MADELPPQLPPPEIPNAPHGDDDQPLSIEDELRTSYLNYAMSVIISRALPDVRDGLKPSQRRILVAMNDLNLGPNSSTTKCAGIVGETMKRYHPHGEATIYPTLVRMAQKWNMRHRLVHPQGNFGSIAGFPPAAMRYTEARLSPVAADMLDDITRDTVDFRENYDGKYQEPVVLPSRFPNLLVNGSDGIAVGMATGVPPHNLREVCDALIALIDAPELGIEELFQIIPGPDFPTGGIICGDQGIRQAYLTGRGRATLRAKAEVVTTKNKSQIVVTEIPYQENNNRIMEKIGELVKNERITGIRDAQDLSSDRQNKPVNIVIDVKNNADPELVLNQLYQFSPLQVTVSIILLALVDGTPRTLTIKQMLEEFLRHRVHVIRRRTEHMLNEAKRRAHILEGQLIAISSLDEVIQICRSSPSRNEAKTRLQDHQVAAAVLERALGADHFAALQKEIGQQDNYHMTEAQAEAVVRMQLGQLAALERDEIIKEYNELRGKITSYEELLSSEHNVRMLVREELLEMRDKYGDDRRTQIDPTPYDQLSHEDLIPEETNVVTFTHKGYIKRLPIDTYRSQRRGGKGVRGGSTRDDDFVEHLFVTSTHAYLLCFTNQGQVYWLRVFHIPEASRTAGGRSIANVLTLREDERITSLIPVRNFEPGYHLLMATCRGLVKKTTLESYSRPKSGGIIGINLNEGDSLIGVAMTHAGDEIILGTANGMAIRFSETDARPMGRNTRGVKGISLQDDDEVVGMVVVDPDGYLLTVCENGYGKRTPFGANTNDVVQANGTHSQADEEIDIVEEADQTDMPETDEDSADRSSMRYRKQNRGGKGLRDIQTKERNGKVVRIAAVKEDDDVMFITATGMVNRTAINEIRVVGRNTKGVRVMNLNEGDKIATLAIVPPEERKAEEEAEQQSAEEVGTDSPGVVELDDPTTNDNQPASTQLPEGNAAETEITEGADEVEQPDEFEEDPD